MCRFNTKVKKDFNRQVQKKVEISKEKLTERAISIEKRKENRDFNRQGKRKSKFQLKSDEN